MVAKDNYTPFTNIIQSASVLENLNDDISEFKDQLNNIII
jgi:hypothetical protein